MLKVSSLHLPTTFILCSLIYKVDIYDWQPRVCGFSIRRSFYPLKSYYVGQICEATYTQILKYRACRLGLSDHHLCGDSLFDRVQQDLIARIMYFGDKLVKIKALVDNESENEGLKGPSVDKQAQDH